MIYLVDTSVLIDVLRRRKDRPALLADLVRQGHTLAISAINVAEIYSGMFPKEEQSVERLFSGMTFFDVTAEIARLAGKLRSAQLKQGKTFALPDILIAATTLHHNMILMTDNRKDFQLPDLRLYDLP